LYVLGVTEKSNDDFADFYEKDLYPEVKDRAANKIAAVADKECRIMGDSQPPWGFLNVYPYLEKYGIVSVANLHTFSLTKWWKVNEKG
jgi:benzoyl-CoA reductase subunit B